MDNLKELIGAGNVRIHGVEWGQILSSYLHELRDLQKVEEELAGQVQGLDLTITELATGMQRMESETSLFQQQLKNLRAPLDGYIQGLMQQQLKLAGLFGKG